MARIALAANPESVDVEAIAAITEAAQLPEGKVCLLVGDPDLTDDCQAVSVPRALISVLGDIAGLEHHLGTEWDCGVSVSVKWAVRQPDFPAYFAYLLGHEYGHATTVLTNLPLAVYEALLISDLPQVSGMTWRYDDTPHEQRYDQFGLAVAQATYGLDALHKDIHRLLAAGTERDEPRLRTLLSVEPRSDLKGLGAELAAFMLPYRDAFLEKWAADAAGMAPGFVRFLGDHDELWSAI